LANHTRTEYFDTGTRIIAKDEYGDKFYVIKQGRVRCNNIGPPQLQQHSSLSHYKSRRYVDLQSGAYFGERSLIRDEMRACDVIALEPTSCHVLSRGDFLSILGPLKEVMERFLALRANSCVRLVKNRFSLNFICR